MWKWAAYSNRMQWFCRGVFCLHRLLFLLMSVHLMNLPIIYIWISVRVWNTECQLLVICVWLLVFKKLIGGWGPAQWERTGLALWSPGFNSEHHK
jgi:hypothetical protein